MAKSEALPWYKEGLSFKCTGCGKCCAGCPGYVWVSLSEIKEMAEHLDLSTEEFSEKYVRKIGKKYSLKELPGKDYSCVFLKNNQCSIYEVRPKQCRTYPFWPQILKSKESWREEAKDCEGISEEQPKVSFDDIQKKRGFDTN